MNNCIYCDNPTKGKVCKNKPCILSYKKQYYHDNIEHCREVKRAEEKRNRLGRKDKEVKRNRQKYYSDNIEHVVSGMLTRAKTRSKQYSLSFDLDKTFLNELFMKQQNKCALTKIDFIYEAENVSVTHKRPFAPSLDRINSQKGYTKDNVRIVCIIVNFALCEFGDDAFHKMCTAYTDGACK